MVAGGGSGWETRGVTVEVGEEESATIELSMAIEYGRSIPRVSEAVRTNVINRVDTAYPLRGARRGRARTMNGRAL